MQKMNLLKSLSTVIFITALTLPAQAGIIGNDKCLFDATGFDGCTANDVSIASMRVVGYLDGCVSSTDTATVQVELDITSGQPDRYNVGIHLDTGGGDAVATGNTCVHEALFDQALVDNSNVDAISGIGPFYNPPLDDATTTCGGVGNGVTYTRRLVQGDIVSPPPSSTTALDIVIACSDTGDGLGGAANGFLDVGWAVGWSVDKTDPCTSILQATATGPAKCQTGVTDTADGYNLVPIGVPNLGVSIVCSPTNVDIGDVVSCTVTYANAAPLGVADYTKFKVNYPGDQGTISNIVNQGVGETNNDDIANDYINWGMDGGLTLDNISAGQTNTMTFDFTYNGGPNFDISIDTFFDNGIESDQNLSATASITTLPVTIAYVNPQEGGNGLEVDFSTSSETSNIGFNVYAVKGESWTKLNDRIIPGALDSFEPRDYHVDLSVPVELEVKKIGIAGIDANGVEDRHGPFKVGQESGVKVTAAKVDWGKIQKQVKADRKAKKAASKATKAVMKDQIITLSVNKDAVYRVTHSDLLEAGTDLNGEKSEDIAISLREEGIARYIAGLSKQSRWTKDSVMEFIGTAPTGMDALYIDTNLYQLSLNKKLAISIKKIEPSMVKTKVFETNNRYSYSLPQEDPFYDGYFYARGEGAPGSLSRNFEMPLMDEGSSTLMIILSAYSSDSHELGVLLNDVQIASKSTEGRTAWTIEVEVDNNLFIEGTNKITLNIPGRGDVFDYLVYDKLTVTYNDGVVNESLTPSIEQTEIINKKEINPKQGTNYVIISHPLFIGETLDRYVKQRESEGWNIKVVNVEDVYEAYGYAMATPNAIKSYLEMVEGKGVTHVQLIGAATYDYHDYLNTGAISFIPSMYAMTAKTIQYTPCDACLVLDESEVPALAIGRWPVRTLEGFEAVVNKTLAWESTGQSATHTALFIADETNKGMNFGRQMEETAQQFVQKGWEDLTRVYLDDIITDNQGDVSAAVTEARGEIAQSLESGASITSYSGHSSPSLWSYKGLLKQSDIAIIDNVGKTTMALPLACFATYADSPYINTMAHQLLAAGENGAVAVYGASTTSYYGDNGVAAKKVIDGLLEGETLGEAVKNMKQSLGARYKDVIRNGVLQGDVTLRLK